MRIKFRTNSPMGTMQTFRGKQELFNLFKKFEWNIDSLELEQEVNGGMY